MFTYYKLGPSVLELESRRRVTMNIDGENIGYFKAEAARTGDPGNLAPALPVVFLRYRP